MDHHQNKVKVAIPIGDVNESLYSLSRRPNSLKGATIGMVDNKKPGSAVLLNMIGELLIAQHGISDIVTVRKPSSVVPVSETAQRDLARCHAIICGVGD